ncbi:MAG: ORF6N domain-containing protein [Cytophagaceae bacterium]
MTQEVLVLPDEVVMNKIYQIRGNKVMLDSDLAAMYGVDTKVLNQAVKRNKERFPEDFMFILSNREFSQLQEQVTEAEWGGRRTNPYVFTEHGVLMLSSVLKSKKAVTVNIQIVRIFTRMREMLLTHKDLLLELEELRKKVSGQDEKIEIIYNYLQQFVQQESEPRVQIGFKTKQLPVI